MIDERLQSKKVLWTGDISANNATLKEKYTNFRYLEFYGYTSDNIPLYTKLDVSSGKTKLQMLGFAFDGNMYVKCLGLTLSDETTVKVSARVNWYKSYNTNSGGYANPDNSSNPIVHLTKIVGIY